MKTKRISNGTSGKIGICIIRWVVFALIAFVVLMPVYWIFIILDYSARGIVQIPH